jgi:hypothetical protein
VTAGETAKEELTAQSTVEAETAEEAVEIAEDETEAATEE